jgi:hypothetical protein
LIKKKTLYKEICLVTSPYAEGIQVKSWQEILFQDFVVTIEAEDLLTGYS